MDSNLEHFSIIVITVEMTFYSELNGNFTRYLRPNDTKAVVESSLSLDNKNYDCVTCVYCFSFAAIFLRCECDYGGNLIRYKLIPGNVVNYINIISSRVSYACNTARANRTLN